MAPKYTLYTYFRSSCSARIRIAAHLKGIQLDYKYVHIVKDEQHASEYSNLNPSRSVPTLVVSDENGKAIATIRQSVAILEYFEEARSDLKPLLPPISNPEERSKVRDLVNIVACDIQPVTNLRIIQKIKPAGLKPEEWQQHFMSLGMKAYEQLASQYAGRYSVGDEVTLADCNLSPAVDNCLRYGVDMTPFPTVNRVYKELQQLEAFQKGGWKAQGDTPEELREQKQ